MHQFRFSGRLLGPAVAVALAAGASPLAAPAFAAAPPAHAGAQAPAAAPAPAAVPRIAPGSEVLAAGPTGFLTRDGEGRVWTKYADGSQTRFGPASLGYARDFGAVEDVVAEHEGLGTTTSVTLTDTRTGRITRVDLAGYEYLGTVGRTLLAEREGALYLLDGSGAGAPARRVAGFSGDTDRYSLVRAIPGRALVSYAGPDDERSSYTLIDLAEGARVPGAVVHAHDVHGIALSTERLVVVHQGDGEEHSLLTSIDLRTGKETETSVPTAEYARLGIGLVGGQLVRGPIRASHQGTAKEDLALKTVPPDGGTARKLLDHASSLAQTPDGALLVRGGTLASGEGLYRISAGAGGVPVAALVASTGEPTVVAVQETDVEKTVALDDRAHRMRWRLSRQNVQMTVTITHVATKQTGTWNVPPAQNPAAGSGWMALDWNRTLATPGRPLSAPAGDYTWKAVFTPRNGLGPAATVTGAFQVTRKSHPHDYTSNGSPDLLDRDAAGKVWLYDSAWNPSGRTIFPTGEFRERKQVPGDWSGYDRIAAAGNAAGGAAGDLVSRDKAGVLWLHLGKGDGTFDTRIKVGAGWQVYKQLTALGDVTNDGKPDLLAADAAGVMWLYRGTGSWKTPYLPRKKAGAGWQGYNKILSVGDIVGTKAGDLLARDTAGVLWSMEGRGDGTFAPRVKVEAGWGGLPHVVGIGDGDRNGRPDLFASNGKADYLYRATGDPAKPLNGRYTLRQDYPGVPAYREVF
ncbi:VCBS repeat-containing protein [Streptomyces sp. NPDC097619]|uniref:FG-GAP repeat domain-containing protein n=1 Tax=Streptomyces sp. NPDC097619 TaxID=3157228 RepID=UPI00332D7AE7